MRTCEDTLATVFPKQHSRRRSSVRRWILLLQCALSCTLANASGEEPKHEAIPSLERVIDHLRKNEDALSAVSVTLDHSRLITGRLSQSRMSHRIPTAADLEGFFVGRWSYESNGRTRYDGFVEETSAKGTRTNLITLAFDGTVARRLETNHESHMAKASLDSYVTQYGIDPREITTHHSRRPVSQILAEKGGPTIESVQLDGRPALLVSTKIHTGNDGSEWQSKYWVDPAIGMSIVRRSASHRANAQSDWLEHSSVRSSEFVEAAPGTWLPTRYCYEHLNQSDKDAEPVLAWRYEGSAKNWQVNESFEDGLFTINFGDDLEVEDYRVAVQNTNGNATEDAGSVTGADNKDVQPVTEPEEKSTATRPAIYDPERNAKEVIAEAVSRAKRDGKHVIVKFGGNWCGWCYRLNDFFHQNEAIATLLRENFELVLVDVDTNRDILIGYGNENEKHGFPFLTVLDGECKVLVNQNTADLEKGGTYDIAAVTSFLSRWQPVRFDARNALDDAKKQAGRQNKLLFVHLGTPWCGWCHRLDVFLERHSDRFGKDFIDVKIDTDRMRHGGDVAKELRKDAEGGVPWFAILDSDGKVLATSDGPNGNIGFPVRDAEIGHFLRMLSDTAKRIDESDLAAIKFDLEAKKE